MIKVKALRNGEFPPGHRRRKGDLFLIPATKHPKGHPKAGQLACKGAWMLEEHEAPPKATKPDFMKGQAPSSRFKSTEAKKHFERTLDQEAKDKINLQQQEDELEWDGEEPPNPDDLVEEDSETGELTVAEPGADVDLTEGEEDTDPVDTGDPQPPAASVYSKPDAADKPKKDEKKLQKLNRKGLDAMKRPELAKIAKEKGVKVPVGMTNDNVVDAILKHQDQEFKKTFVKPDIRKG